MKILLVTESYWPNADGGALFERRLAHGVAGLGHQVSIWAAGNRWRSFIQPDPPTTIYREKAIRFLINPKYKVSFWPFWNGGRIIKRVRPDILHIHNAFLMGLAALAWARLRRLPVVATNHFMPENALLNLKASQMLYRPLHRLIWAYLVWFHNRCDFVTSPTPTAVRLLVEHGLKTLHRPISNGIDTKAFAPGVSNAAIKQKYHLPGDRPIALYLGRVDGEKRLDLIITALPLILQQRALQLVIAGAGVALASLQQQAQQLGVAEHVTFTGFIDEADKPALYNAATCFVISSPAELQSIVTLEAMACGLPILSVDVAALSELCRDGQNGYLFRPNDPADLAAKALKLLSSPQLEQFGQASRRIVEQEHSTEVTFKEYAQVYLEAAR